MKEPSVGDTINILRGIKEKYEVRTLTCMSVYVGVWLCVVFVVYVFVGEGLHVA